MLLTIPTITTAHESRPAYLELAERTPNHYDVIWRRPAIGDQVLALAPRFPTHCRDVTPHTLQKTASAVQERWALRCEASLIGQPIMIEGLTRTITDVLIRVSLDGNINETHIARPHTPNVIIQGSPTSLAVARSYVLLGIEHIWSGVDHLLFVAALLLLVQNRWLLFKTITAFTLAHSITLGLATLGLAHAPQTPVEAVIALSILFLAVELAKERTSQQTLTFQYPWLVAFMFGLLHGFGFAGALTEVGLPPTDIPLALLTFNIGVEVGQLAFIFVTFAVAFCVRYWRALRAPAWRQTVVYAIGAVSAFWLIQRIVGFF